MARKKCIHHLRNDGVFISHDTRKEIFTAIQFADQIRPQFFFNGSLSPEMIGKTTRAKRA